jgi:hypothetical protein
MSPTVREAAKSLGCSAAQLSARTALSHGAARKVRRTSITGAAPAPHRSLFWRNKATSTLSQLDHPEGIALGLREDIGQTRKFSRDRGRDVLLEEGFHPDRC